MGWPFGKKKRKEPEKPEPMSMARCMELARAEIDALMAQDPDWYHHLPYTGGMSKGEARRFEIEKRALWKRVIHDARRGDIAGLRWSTRSDALVCDQCRRLEGKVFKQHELEELAGMVMHLGCRCELVPVR